MILARGGDPLAALSAEERDFWRSLGGKVARLGKDGFDRCRGTLSAS